MKRRKTTIQNTIIGVFTAAAVIFLLSAGLNAEVIRIDQNQRALLDRMIAGHQSADPHRQPDDADGRLQNLKKRTKQIEKQIQDLKAVAGQTDKPHPLLKQYDAVSDRLRDTTHTLTTLNARLAFVSGRIEAAHNRLQVLLRTDPVLGRLEDIVAQNRRLLRDFREQPSRTIDLVNVQNRLAASIADVEYRKQQLHQKAGLEELNDEKNRLEYTVVDVRAQMTNLSDTHRALQNRIDADAPAPAATIRLRKLLIEYENTLESLEKLEKITEISEK